MDSAWISGLVAEFHEERKAHYGKRWTALRSVRRRYSVFPKTTSAELAALIDSDLQFGAWALSWLGHRMRASNLSVGQIKDALAILEIPLQRVSGRIRHLLGLAAFVSLVAILSNSYVAFATALTAVAFLGLLALSEKADLEAKENTLKEFKILFERALVRLEQEASSLNE